VNSLRRGVETAAVGAALVLAHLLPRRWLLAVGAGFGAFAGRVLPRRTAIVRENLTGAYGDSLPDSERERVMRACWRHFGRITFDALAFPQLDQASLDATIRVEGLEHAREALAHGKGMLVFSAHYGHWEAGAYAMGLLGVPFAVIARPLDNPTLDLKLIELRKGSGNAVIPKRRAVRETIRALARGSGVAILIDQDAGAEGGVFVPFFGRPAATTPTLALLALRTEAPIVPVFADVDPDGTIRVHIEPAVPTEATGDRDADVVRVTAACTAIVERWVRKHPEQWLWMHRRWKTKPGSGAAQA